MAETGTTAAAAQEAEAQHETDPYITVPLAGHDGAARDVRVLPPTHWRASAMRALNGGDMDAFMSLVLHEDDYEVYVELDPDMDAIGQFAADAAREAGEELGKSSGRPRSSRRTRRR